MIIYLKRRHMSLAPSTDDDMDLLKRIPMGADIKCSITIPRNVKFHRKFFVMLNMVLDNMPEDIQRKYCISNVHTFLDYIKIDLGEFDKIIVDGIPVIKLHSISFSKMDQLDFEKFYDRTIDLLLSKYLRGVDRRMLIEQVEEQTKQVEQQVEQFEQETK